MEGLLRFSWGASLVLLSLFTVPLQAGPDSERSDRSTPDLSQLRSHIHFLSSDELKGRKAGTEGTKVASRYISSRFRSWGLKPYSSSASETSYIQTFPLHKITYRAHIEITGPANRTVAINAPVFEGLDFHTSGEEPGRGLVFAGYGITDPDRAYNDYRDVEVDGKYVVILRHAPNESDPDSVFDGSLWASGANIRKKYETAKENGAKGVFLINDPLGEHKRFPDHVSSPRWSLEKKTKKRTSKQSIPFVALTPEQGAKLLGITITDLRLLQIRINQGPDPKSVELDHRSVSVSVSAEVIKQFTARNVIGYLPGSESEENDEHIIVGAHYDHLGTRSAGHDRIFNGADDNASGTAAILELARIFARRHQRLNRSLVFVLFSAEEKGMFGSKYYVQNPVKPLQKAVAMINFDMIGGSDGTVSVYGARDHQLFLRLNRVADRRLSDTKFTPKKRSEEQRSDHTVFARSDVPSLFYFTGYHNHYHTVNDELNKINFPGLKKIVQHGSYLIEHLGTTPPPTPVKQK